MTKSTVTRLFVGGIVAVVAGLILGLASVIAAFAGGGVQTNGPDVVGIDATPFAWSMVALAILAIVAIVGGAIAGLIAWIGALLNTAQLDDKTWFVVLLVLGLWNLGFIAMVVYCLAGPDGTERGSRGHAAA